VLLVKKYLATVLMFLFLASCRGNIASEYSEYKAEHIRAVNTACAAYQAAYSERGFPKTLSQLGPASSNAQPDAEHGGLIDSVLASGKKSGSIITYTPGEPNSKGQITHYGITERPQQFGVSGKRSFFSDETAVIHFTDGDRAPNLNDPVLK
jgi:hypothetical protein